MKRDQPDSACPDGKEELAAATEGAEAEASHAAVVAKARATIGIPKADLISMLSCPEDYDKVLNACAQNAKMGPFTATSGLVLDYYLNVSTNMMDPVAAPSITRMVLDVMQARFRPADGSKVFLVGMEMAGGIMVGQCAAMAPLTHPAITEWCEFVYCRKDRKTSGTCQQLEGPTHITTRTPESPAVKGVWLDDCMSSGGSMRDGVNLLKADYNINMIGSLYLADRSRDRTEIAEARLGMAHPSCKDMDNTALYDLDPHMHAGIMSRV